MDCKTLFISIDVEYVSYLIEGATIETAEMPETTRHISTRARDIPETTFEPGSFRLLLFRKLQKGFYHFRFLITPLYVLFI